ncbi:hypothetical protein KO495_04810 [Colwellia sp. D2M02]|uniref:hypothetical protein n=1 Tax=Colwellia sp. D2M02 TaxID=2841562 RepID=UPI001C0907A0|nr:hypothetical protein [Colwellia sp. D2M02]MBU2892645.1 hypothetical protein [Colwellia sp. D2M02]
MSNSQLTFRGIAPIHSPLSLYLGVDQFSPTFISSLKSVNLEFSTDDNGNQVEMNWQGKVLHLGGQQNEVIQYQSTDDNSKDIRLMCWSPSKDSNVMFHVFANHIAIAEVEFTVDITELSTSTGSVDSLIKVLESRVQNIAKEQITLHYEDFCKDLKQLHSQLSKDFVFSGESSADIGTWIARTLILNDDDIQQESTAKILTSWLKNTSRPQDAADIISGHKNYSMTWLNYAVKNAKAVGEDSNIQIMVLAQYYYVAQEHCNSALRGSIEAAYARVKKHKIDKVLANTRTACRLNQIAFYENIKFLNRPNRALLENILNGWQFEQLVENSDRMIEICNARLQEEDNKKRERSTIMTDFLLVALSFFAVFELSLYLTEFSREMMSRPALDYNDSKSSYFLGLIAEIDADIMFSFGFGLTLLLIIVYRYIKRN